MQQYNSGKANQWLSGVKNENFWMKKNWWSTEKNSKTGRDYGAKKKWMGGGGEKVLSVSFSPASLRGQNDNLFRRSGMNRDRGANLLLRGTHLNGHRETLQHLIASQSNQMESNDLKNKNNKPI